MGFHGNLIDFIMECLWDLPFGSLKCGWLPWLRMSEPIKPTAVALQDFPVIHGLQLPFGYLT